VYGSESYDSYCTGAIVAPEPSGNVRVAIIALQTLRATYKIPTIAVIRSCNVRMGSCHQKSKDFNMFRILGSLGLIPFSQITLESSNN